MGVDSTENASGDDGRANIIHSSYVTRNGQVFRVDTYSNGTTNYFPVSAAEASAASGSSGGTGGPSSAGPSWAQQQSVAQHTAATAEDARRWQEEYDVNKAKFNAQQGLAEATQKWREATDSRDFGAAEFWKSRAYELQRNAQTMDYTKQLQSMSGPEDYVKYWYASRGMTTPRGAESVRYEDAIPSWAQPVPYGQGAPTANTTTTTTVPTPTTTTTPAWAGADLRGFTGTPAGANTAIGAAAQHPVEFGSTPTGGLTSENQDFFDRMAKMGVVSNVPKWAGAPR